MFIKSIHLKNILSFGEDTPVLELQDLNILIGANGSGKSNLIDVIELIQNFETDGINVIRKTGGVQNWIWRRNELKQKILSSVKTTFFNDLYIKFNLETETFFTSFVNYPKKVEFENFSIFRDWGFGRKTDFRQPQLYSDNLNEFLNTDFSNLNSVLKIIRGDNVEAPNTLFFKALKKINENYNDFSFTLLSDNQYIELKLHEGDIKIPSTRLSDGTLRYLCLLAILCHPNPPPLICIEEPELGFHPDLLPTIAELLKDASTRTQLIVTTHSDILIDCFSDKPEAVIVFEKENGATKMTRLSKEKLTLWLKKYSLGRLWIDGHLGGKRW